MLPPRNQDDHQQDHQGRSNRRRDQKSMKQFLISSYINNLQPLDKEDIHQNVQNMTQAIQGTSPSQSKRVSTSTFNI